MLPAETQLPDRDLAACCHAVFQMLFAPTEADNASKGRQTAPRCMRDVAGQFQYLPDPKSRMRAAELLVIRQALQFVMRKVPCDA